jgi:uncharacterized protein (TIGR03435 family)
VRRGIVVAAVSLASVAARAQVAPTVAPVPITPLPAEVADARFDAVSIKVNRSGALVTDFGRFEPGRYTATNAPIAFLIGAAYGARNGQFEGIPAWASSTRVDIIATIAGGPATPARQIAMLRNLLMDRFRLSTRTEVKEQPLYALVKARADGRLGHKIRLASPECQAIRAGWATAPPAKPGEVPQCGILVGFGRVEATGQPISSLANALGSSTDRIVVDRTALRDAYAFELVWTPQQAAGRGVPLVVNGLEIDPNGPSLFTAIQEQLGLKLEPTRGPVEVLVVERIEPPADD